MEVSRTMTGLFDSIRAKKGSGKQRPHKPKNINPDVQLWLSGVKKRPRYGKPDSMSWRSAHKSNII